MTQFLDAGASTRFNAICSSRVVYDQGTYSNGTRRGLRIDCRSPEPTANYMRTHHRAPAPWWECVAVACLGAPSSCQLEFVTDLLISAQGGPSTLRSRTPSMFPTRGGLDLNLLECPLRILLLFSMLSMSSSTYPEKLLLFASPTGSWSRLSQFF